MPMKLLDQPHPDVANPLPDRATSLMAFAYRGEEALAEDLLARGAEPDARDADGYTALMYAANQGHHGCVRSLLAHGASPNAADEQGSTPLMFAAQHGHTRIAKRLLDAGANPDSRGDHGFTPLDVDNRTVTKRRSASHRKPYFPRRLPVAAEASREPRARTGDQQPHWVSAAGRIVTELPETGSITG